LRSLYVNAKLVFFFDFTKCF